MIKKHDLDVDEMQILRCTRGYNTITAITTEASISLANLLILQCQVNIIWSHHLGLVCIPCLLFSFD